MYRKEVSNKGHKVAHNFNDVAHAGPRECTMLYVCDGAGVGRADGNSEYEARGFGLGRPERVLDLCRTAALAAGVMEERRFGTYGILEVEAPL